jgi:DNA (cytosine-5)-methyltransferase 1
MASGEVVRKIKPGDTVSTRRDGEKSGSVWKRELANSFLDVDRWFAIVQKVHEDGNGGREFEVLWYYRAVDTICGLMKYPWQNELFLSDHCSCSERHKIRHDEILGTHTVDFGGDSATKSEFFCRQTYLTVQKRWVTLKDAHFPCSHIRSRHQTKSSSSYQHGDTVLLQLQPGSSISEPCEITRISKGDNNTHLRCRRLLRRRDIDPNTPSCAPNELVYSHEYTVCSMNQVVANCHVRVFRHDAAIPTPYDRSGVGGFFYITHEVLPSGVCVPLQTFPRFLRQGYDPTVAVPQLRGLDLFCGGGNFGRGLEEGGAVTMDWANDYDAHAIHTYMANCRHPTLMSPFLGSIDDFQRHAIAGKFSKAVPTIGTVDFISGGSPCPGFSILTNNKTTDAQRKNQSLVAAFASCIDLYRPKFGLLENVPGIVQAKSNREQDVLSQLVCAIVGMGYQAELFFIHSSSYGSAQRRPRVFLMFAAPNVKLPSKPQQTHSFPPEASTRTLGRLATGDALAEVDRPRATPFEFVTARQATSGLPKIYDGQPDTCIPYPDHRLPRGLTRSQRSRISLIPTRPWGMSFRKASEFLTPADQLVFSRGGETVAPAKPNSCDKTSSAYGRIFPNLPIGTITTSQSPGDRKHGNQLHWDENRAISIMEARRAQGFLDDEVILGTPPRQYKIVGNSVAREVALALGLSIREAWVESYALDPNGRAITPSTESLKGYHANRRVAHGHKGDEGRAAQKRKAKYDMDWGKPKQTTASRRV